MEAVISNMLRRFESGALTRRELIQGLAMLTTAGATASAAGLQAPPAFKSPTIDHISIQVSDLPRSVAFYKDVFGLSVVSEDKPNEIVRLGLTKTRVSLHHKSPTALMDHFAIGVDPFNKEAVTRHLMQHGLTPEENIDAGFHVKDPEGIRVQIVQADTKG
jgi:catechol 2,3-dioxygenase-like lactoylglutathione lyase family enzyme